MTFLIYFLLILGTETFAGSRKEEQLKMRHTSDLERFVELYQNSCLLQNGSILNKISTMSISLKCIFITEIYYEN